MNRWVEGARPKTLAAAVVPVVVGTAAAQELVPWRFLAALLVALAIQIGVNYANDYFDGRSGVDTAERAGPRRLTASGLATHGQMKIAIAASFFVAGCAGLALAAATSWWLLVAGGAAFLAAIAYSGGPKPYASLGLGEVFVFVFFGLVATAGSAYVQVEELSSIALVSSVPVGLLAVAILVANNVRDITTDAAAGKRTLAVRLGAAGTRRLYRLLVAAAFAALFWVAAAAEAVTPLLPFFAMSFAVRPTMLIAREDGPGLVQALVATARLHWLFGALLAAGLAMR